MGGNFEDLWENGSTTRYHDDQVISDHPVAGEITVDCDILTLPEDDLRAVVFTAEGGSDDAERLRDTASKAW